jgi:hypothetical protein
MVCPDPWESRFRGSWLATDEGEHQHDHRNNEKEPRPVRHDVDGIGSCSREVSGDWARLSFVDRGLARALADWYGNP